MLLLMGAALLVAQTVNFAFILNEQQKLSLAQNEGPAITRFAQTAGRVSAVQPAMRPVLAADRPGPGAIYRIADRNPIDAEGLERDSEVERRLARALAEAGVRIRALRGATPGAPPQPPEGHMHPFHGERRLVLLAAQLDDGD